MEGSSTSKISSMIRMLARRHSAMKRIAPAHVLHTAMPCWSEWERDLICYDIYFMNNITPLILQKIWRMRAPWSSLNVSIKNIFLSVFGSWGFKFPYAKTTLREVVSFFIHRPNNPPCPLKHRDWDQGVTLFNLSSVITQRTHPA